MTTYPLSFPAGALFATAQFNLNVTEAVNTTRSGAIQVMQLGDPLWSAEFETIPLTGEERALWQAWKVALRGSIGTFLCSDPEKAYPRAYGAAVLALTRAGGGAFDGVATLTTATAFMLSLSGLPSGYQASAGDMLAFPWNGSRALHMVMESAVASEAGLITVSVEPAVRLSPAPTSGAAVDLVKPSCLMRIMPGSWEAPAAAERRAIRFEAVQVP